MGSLTSQLIISLIDKVSGPAKGAAASLKGVAAAEKTLAGAGGAKGVDSLTNSLKRLQSVSSKQYSWGDSFQRNIDKLKLTSREIEQVGRDYARLQNVMRGTKASSALDTLDHWKTRTIANIHAVRRAQEEHSARQERISNSLRGGVRHGARLAVGALGVGSVAYAGERGLHAAVKSAAERQRESIRYQQMGFSPDEQADAEGLANKVSSKYPSLSRTEILTDLRKNAARLGGFEHAKEIAEVYARAKISNKISGGDEHELEQVVRAAEGAGAANTPGQFASFLNAFAKAKAANPDYTGNDFAKDFRAAGAAKYGLGKDYMENVFPILASHTPGFGVKLATSNSALIGGRQTKAAKAQLQRAGLLGKDGRLIDEAGYQANPYEWTQQHVRPILEKKGVTFNDHMSEEDKRTTSAWATRSFSAKNVADQIITNLLDAPLVERARQRKTVGLEGADNFQKSDPGLALEAAKKQTEDFTTALLNLRPVIDMMNAYAKSVSWLTNDFANDKRPGQQAGKVIGGTILAGGAAAGALVGAKNFYQWFTGAAALTGSATALDASAAALSAAAVKLGGGSILSDLPGGKKAPSGSAKSSIFSKVPGALKAAGGLALGVVSSPIIIGAAVGFGAEELNNAQGITRESTRERQRRQAAKYDWMGKYIGTPDGGASQIERGPDIWSGGANPIQNLNQADRAGSYGAAAAGAYRANFTTELLGVDGVIDAAIARWAAKLGSFSASPTITPKIGGIGSVGGPNDFKTKYAHATFSDGPIDVA